MTQSSRRLLWAVLLGSAALLPPGTASAQPPEARLQKVFADWQKRQDRVKSIRYTLVGELVIPKGSLTGESDLPDGGKTEFPRRDVVTEKKITLLLDFPSNRSRIESSGQELLVSKGQLSPRVSTTVFDGKALKTAIPRGANTSEVHAPHELDADVTIASGNLASMHVEANYWPILFAHGCVPTVHNPPRQDAFRIKPDPEIWTVHGVGNHAGRSCLVLRTLPLQHMDPLFDECWVDPARDSAVVRQLYYANGKPWYDWDIQYESTAHGWLPKSWTWTFRAKGQTRRIERMRIAQHSADIPVTGQDFRVEITPGMIVYETNQGGTGGGASTAWSGTKYRVGANGRWNPIESVGEATGRRGGVASAWWGLVIAVLALPLGLWLLRRWRSRPGVAG